METIDKSLKMQSLSASIDDLPDEVLEFILSFLPPYKDLQDCTCVCRRWYICANAVMRNTTSKLVKSIAEFKIQWKNITPVDMAPTITKRFSHAACVYENSMYIFGGCTTNSTAFNDLWRFDLSKRQWIRPLAMGTYPVPKAYTSMISYKDNLVLFGGWTYPSPSQYYQHWTMFNEIHFYNITLNRWILINSTNNPPPMAGHSAVIHGDSMVVFGGLNKSFLHHSQIQCSNDIWRLDLISMHWRKQTTSDPKPSPRYAQSLIQLDSNNIMILGGVQAPLNKFVYNDCWVLNMEGDVWKWREIQVKNKEWAAANIWCNPACRVGDKVVSLSRTQNGTKPLVTSAIRLSSRNTANNAPVSVRVEQYARRPVDRDQNVNGKRGVLPQRNLFTSKLKGPSENVEVEPKPSTSQNFAQQNPSTSNSSGDCGISPSVDVRNSTNNAHRDITARRKISPLKPNNLKIVHQLQEINKYRMAAFSCDIPIRNPTNENNPDNERQNAGNRQRIEVEPPILNDIAPVKKSRRNTLSMHVLDISTILNGNLNYVSWLRPRLGEVSGAPEELVMYSLVQGKGELIMFGGVTNDINLLSNYASSQHQYSNSLHFITTPRDII